MTLAINAPSSKSSNWPATVIVEKPSDAPEPYTRDEFAALAAAYPDLRLELSREGEVTIMPPAGSKTGNRNIKVAGRLEHWSEEDGTGEAFDSSAGFTLPNGAQRSPDASWIAKGRWEALTEDEQEDFAPICPDFVVELRSRTDRLSTLQKKMREYIDNGAKLGWLIDPKNKRVEVYRPGQDEEVLENPTSVSGEPILPGFTLNLAGILT